MICQSPLSNKSYNISHSLFNSGKKRFSRWVKNPRKVFSQSEHVLFRRKVLQLGLEWEKEESEHLTIKTWVEEDWHLVDEADFKLAGEDGEVCLSFCEWKLIGRCWRISWRSRRWWRKFLKWTAWWSIRYNPWDMGVNARNGCVYACMRRRYAIRVDKYQNTLLQRSNLPGKQGLKLFSSLLILVTTGKSRRDPRTYESSLLHGKTSRWNRRNIIQTGR